MRERESKRKRITKCQEFLFFDFLFEGTINPSTLIIQKNLFI